MMCRYTASRLPRFLIPDFKSWRVNDVVVGGQIGFWFSPAVKLA
jgi:hypothetical protein